ncbi:EAL domain-containing protein [Enterobacteriaceae bacterium RIT691]|nr:EAL domain-containing protein [Enterobacteriaceae bacterium RIT691]
MKTTAEIKVFPLSFFNTLILVVALASALAVGVLSHYLSAEVQEVFSVMNRLLLKDESALLTHQVTDYLDTSYNVGRLLSHILPDVTVDDDARLQAELQHLMTVDFASSDPLSRVSFASADGRYTGFARSSADNQLHLVTAEPDGQGTAALVTHQTESARSPIIHTIADYHVLVRPWFIQAKTTLKSAWTESYQHGSLDAGEVMSYRKPVLDSDGHFMGVISVDISPSHISNWLQKLAENRNQQLMLEDPQGKVIATTGDIAPEVYRAIDCPDRHQCLQKHRFSSGATLTALPSQHQLMVTRPVGDSEGLLNWRLMLLSPDNPWGTLINHYRLHNLLSLLSVMVAGILFIFLMLRRFTHPFIALIDKIHLVGTPSWSLDTSRRIFPSMAKLGLALDNKSNLILSMLEERQKLVEFDQDTGLLTLAGLKNQPDLFQNRNRIALIHISNYSSLFNLFGPKFGKLILDRVIHKLRTTLPESTLLCRERTDKILVVFPPESDEIQRDLWLNAVERLFTQDEAIQSGERAVVVTGNAGLVKEDITPESWDQILLNAGIALHHARHLGNGRVGIFETAMYEKGLQNMQMLDQLHFAIERNEFHLVMQPIINLKTGECHEGECLIRWHNPTLGMVRPDQFIALAEETGFIIPVGNWITERACQELASFIARGAPADFKLHVNVSPLQLQQPDFAMNLYSTLRRYGLKAENLCMELTESVLLNKESSVIKQLSTIREMGVTISLDDFGSGYSSLSYLHTLPFDQLKIDRQFVRDVMENERSESVVSSVLNLSQSFGVPLVAEGIENQELGEKLLGMGCELAQGYHYGRPLPFAEWGIRNGLILCGALMT